MADSKFETELLIKAGVKGLEAIAKLGSEIEAAGVDVSALSKQSDILNKTFDDLENQTSLISQFRNLKTAAKEVSDELLQSQVNSSKLSQEWKASEALVNSHKATLDKQTASLAEQKQSINEQVKALKSLGRATKENKEEVSKQRAELKQQRQAYQEQKQVLVEQRAEYKKAVQASKTLVKSQQQSVKETRALKVRQAELNASLQKTRTAMQQAGLSTKGLAQQEQTLQKQTKEAEQSLTELNAEAVKLQQIAKAKVTLGIDTDEKARQEIINATKAYETLKNSGQLTNAELSRANQLHTQTVAKLEAQLAKTVPEATSLASEMGKLATAAGGLAYVAKEAISFEQAMAGVRKTVDGTPEQIQALSSEIKQLSVDLGLASEDVAAIAAQGGQLGVPIDQLAKFTEMAGKMAVAFDLSAEEAADAAAKLANVFEIPIIQVESLGDAINTLGNNTAAKEREIVSALLRIGGSAKQFGLLEEQAASLAAAMIALGKPPEVAATAINALLTKLQTAQGQGQKFQDALAGIGLSADELAQNIQANPQQALSDFLQKLGELDAQQRSMVNFQLFGQEYSDDISLLVGSLDTYNKALGLTADQSQTAGAMNQEFNAQMAATAKQIDQAKQALSVLAQNLGSQLLPIISATASGVTDLATGINSISESYPVLSQLAVLFAGGKVAMLALNGVMRLAGTIGLKSGANIAKGFLGGKTAIDAASASAIRFKSMDLSGLAAGLGRITKAFSAIGAVGLVAYEGSSWLYENVPLVTRFGDELARIPAMLHSMVTTGDLDQYRENFETSAEVTKRLATETKKASEATETQASAQEKAAESAKKQADANRNLANEIKITEANVKLLTERLAQMESDGNKGSQTYQDLSAELEQLQTKLGGLRSQAESAGIGETLKTDLEKASDAFEALGLDATEFATGLDSKTTTALNAFVTVARLAENDTAKLARAYTAAKEQAGDNAQAQALLEQKLKQVTQGNQELANAVKSTAAAQKDASSAASDQSAALDSLGISMDAVNSKMSTAGAEMVDTLQDGVTAIKAQATSAEALETALTQALDVALPAAKTKADFEGIQKVLQDAGVTSRVTAEQMKLLNAGVAGGAEAANKALATTEKQTDALKKNTDATKENADAKQQQADASKQAASAQQDTASSIQNATDSLSGMTSSIVAYAHQQVHGLQQIGLTADQTQSIMSTLFDSIVGMRYPDYSSYANAIQSLTDNAVNQAKTFARLKSEAASMAQTLGGATVSSNDLSRAQGILKRATTATVNGMIRMDSQTLDNLKSAIDQARQRMKGLANDAKNTADSLEATLAKLKGDDAQARRIEQSKKLAELEEKLQEARRRGNAEEIRQLERALELQRKINREENRQAKEQERERSQSSTSTSGSNRSRPSGGNSNISADEVAAAWEKRIEEAERNAADQAVNKFAKELRDSASTRSR